MIYNHQYKFVFLQIPRTATRTMTRILSTACKQKMPVLANRHTHFIPARDWLGATTWNSYFKFAFVRNPWDRHVSSYLMRRTRKAYTNLSFKVFIKTQKVNLYHQYLLDENEKVAIDFIGKIEELDVGVNFILDKLTLPKVDIPNIGKSSNRTGNYISYYTENWMIEAVRDLYRPELIDYLGYRFGD